MTNGTSFATLFKKYRLRSEIETLSEFGDLLAQEGIVYETSLFTRWQNGERIPRDRRVILTIVRLFIKLGGVKLIEEINEVFESIDQRNLSMEEINGLDISFNKNPLNLLPSQPKVFFHTSPLSRKFETYTRQVYKEIADLGYEHLNSPDYCEYFRKLIKEVCKGNEEKIDEYKKRVEDVKQKIKIANICVFETSTRSIGGGYLVHEALDCDKPTLILYYKTYKPYLLSALVNKNLILKSYNEHNIQSVILHIMHLISKKKASIRL